MSEMRRTLTHHSLALFVLTLFLWVGAAAAATDQATNMPSSGGINAVLKANRATAEPDFLPPDQAFQVAAFADGPDRVRVQWAIHEGYYLYKSRIKLATTSKDAQLGAPSLPKGKPKHDDYFGDQEVYHDSLDATVSVARKPGGGKLTLPLDVTYQGCAEAGLCYPPITKTLEVALGAPVAAAAAPSSGADAAAGGGFVSKQDYLADLVKNGNILALLGVFFLGGLVLAFTPCVLPMVPILSGLIVGQGANLTPMRGFTLAFTYVQGMALTYAAAGAVFAAFFKQAPQGFFQQPWIIGLFCLLFIALAFAMYGAFTLQLPSALQTRLTNVSNNQKSGTFVGVLIMGALSALIVTACVAPAMVAALSVISQSGSVGRGAAALYATGLGMGAPLLLVGASAGSLLPRVGPWMDTVKAVFGTLFLGVAIYFGQQLVPATVGLLLWAGLAVIAGFWILSWKARDGSLAPAAIRAPGLIAVVYGILLLIGVASGAKDPLEPLSELRASRGGPAIEGATVAGAVAPNSGLNFETIKTVDELKQRVAAAAAAGKPVMLDFYADWCASCKEMERYTFTDTSVQAALSNAVLLRADVTRNDAADQALLKHFGIFGPPTIAFYDPAGQEQQRFRVVGYMKAPEFASVLQQALSGTKPI